MGVTKQSSMPLLLALITLSSMINSSNGDGSCSGSGAISVYWGQRSNDEQESTLQETCATGNYKIVILESLIVYDDGSTPVLNLAAHCGSATNPCTNLQPQIQYCQQNNIKIFLSIGQDQTSSSKTPSSKSQNENVTEDLAEYILQHYLSGQPGPLGNVTLDGIDIADVADSEHLQWDELVKILSSLSTTQQKIYLSAAPQCVYPDYYLGDAIGTGLLDYIWVEFFYQNPCIYANGDSTNLLNEWNKWTSKVPKSLIFLGLAASPDAVSAGYIKPDALISDVLPNVKNASNYGGVMLWDRYYDIQNNYSSQIKDSVGKECRCVCDGDSAWTSFYGLRPGALTM